MERFDSLRQDRDGSGGGGGEAAGPTWVFVGLGARGLVYHAWLGRCAALAALGSGEAALPPETLEWQQPRAAAGAGSPRQAGGGSGGGDRRVGVSPLLVARPWRV